jgi:hypothetical protein
MNVRPVAAFRIPATGGPSAAPPPPRRNGDMTTVKRITDLTDYTTVLPYASELFGVYQPLLGWKSRRIAQRIADGYRSDRSSLLDKLIREFSGIVEIRYADNQRVDIALKPGVLAGGKIRSFDSVVLDRIAVTLPPFDALEPATWQAAVTADRVNAILKKDVVDFYTRAFPESHQGDARLLDAASRGRVLNAASAIERKNS